MPHSHSPRRMRGLLVAAVVVAMAGAALGPARALPVAGEAPLVPALVDALPSGLERLVQLHPVGSEPVLGIATFDSGPPSSATVDAMRGLGLEVQGLRHLPMAFVFGPVAQLQRLVTGGLASDVYPNEQLDYFSEPSDAAIRATEVHQLACSGDVPCTGQGVGVAIIDSGIDATHPALANRVTHNVKFVGPEVLGLVGLTFDDDFPPGTLVLPVDQGPYNNSDTSSGHGTHVAGIVGADGTGDPTLLGVAPGAELIGYGTGDVLFIFTVIAAYEDMLEHRDEWNIDVANNSWGSSFQLFDPDHPINRATRAAHDAGITVVFAAGNDGEHGTVNPYSVAPWVISAGSATLSRERSSFSSGGLQHDNSTASSVPNQAHVRWGGDRIGLYHPDVSAPGTDIVSAGTPTGAAVGPTAPGGQALASGTSMASPHVAGLAALLLQARPDLTPTQVRDVMQVTAVPMADGSTFWQSGYGFIDARAAVDAVLSPSYSPEWLAAAQAEADRRVLAARDWQVLTSDMWKFTSLLVTAAGLDHRNLTVDVGPETAAVAAHVVFPSTGLVGINMFEYSLTLVDAAGRVVATSEVLDTTGVSELFVDLRQPLSDGTAVEYGEWTLVVAGELGVSDLDVLLGNNVTVHLAELTPQAREAEVPTGPVFTPTSTLPLYFTPSGEPGPLPSPEGCAYDPTATVGGLDAAPVADECRAGAVGYVVNYALDVPAVFTSPPLAEDVAVGGPGQIVTYLADLLSPAWSVGFASQPSYDLSVVAPDGSVRSVAAGDTTEVAQVGPTPVRGVSTFDVPASVLPAGSSLRVTLRFSGVYTATMRFLYGGAYSDAGIVLTTGVAA